MPARAWRLVLAAALLLSPAIGWGWGADGHRALAQAGYGSLTIKQQRALAPLMAAAPMVPKRVKGRPDVALAELAVWPDRVRDLTLAKLFSRYGSGAVPPALRPWQRRNTASWHYRNERFVDGKGRELGGGACVPKPSGDLVAAFDALKRAFAEVDTPRDQVLILAFLLHLGGDAYQPLHRMAQVDRQCRHDRGGNGFCVAPTRGNRCERNLHQLWDGGFGVFESSLQPSRPPRKLDLSGALQFDAEEIYPPRAPLSTGYQQRARATVERMAGRGAGFNKLILQRISACLEGGRRRCTTL